MTFTLGKLRQLGKVQCLYFLQVADVPTARTPRYTKHPAPNDL